MIDVLAWHRGHDMLLVIELKTDIVDINELVGTLDRKRRLARQVAQERGWSVAGRTAVSSWLIVAESKTSRRRVQAHATMLRAVRLPLDGRAMRGWLRAPVKPVGGLSFWSNGHRGNVRGRSHSDSAGPGGRRHVC